MVGAQGLPGAGQGVGLNPLPACLGSGSFVGARQGHGSASQGLSRTVVRLSPIHCPHRRGRQATVLCSDSHMNGGTEATGWDVGAGARENAAVTTAVSSKHVPSRRGTPFLEGLEQVGPARAPRGPPHGAPHPRALSHCISDPTEAQLLLGVQNSGGGGFRRWRGLVALQQVCVSSKKENTTETNGMKGNPTQTSRPEPPTLWGFL